MSDGVRCRENTCKWSRPNEDRVSCTPCSRAKSPILWIMKRSDVEWYRHTILLQCHYSWTVDVISVFCENARANGRKWGKIISRQAMKVVCLEDWWLAPWPLIWLQGPHKAIRTPTPLILRCYQWAVLVVSARWRTILLCKRPSCLATSHCPLKSLKYRVQGQCKSTREGQRKGERAPKITHSWYIESPVTKHRSSVQVKAGDLNK